MITTPRAAPRVISILVATLVATGCTGGSPGGASPTGASPTGTAPSPSSFDRPSVSPPGRQAPTPTVAVVGEVPPAIVDEARSMLAATVGADAAASAELVVAEAVTWPDGSLGCPQPGQAYTQMVVPGYHLVFDVNGTQYDYRATESGAVSACEARGPRAS